MSCVTMNTLKGLRSHSDRSSTCMNVVLPQPEAPTMLTNSPRSKSSEMLSSTTRRPLLALPGASLLRNLTRLPLERFESISCRYPIC